tara:strand:+ start:171 stop:308 length:138 start_codon:yes stop_codon:yes gene_type:complete
MERERWRVSNRLIGHRWSRNDSWGIETENQGSMKLKIHQWTLEKA